MLDYDVVCSGYDERNGRFQTIEHDIEMNIKIRLLNIPSWWVTIPSRCFVASIWTQRIRFFREFHYLLWTTYLLDYNYIVVPLPTGFYVSAYLNGEGVQ
jgi:hypothetical protein